jgi:hypothetical protein
MLQMNFHAKRLECAELAPAFEPPKPYDRPNKLELSNTWRFGMAGLDYFPMQKWLKIVSSRSSVVVWPTISPTAFTAMRRSRATSSSV